MRLLALVALCAAGCTALDSTVVEHPTENTCTKYGFHADDIRGKIAGYRHLEADGTHSVLIVLPQSKTQSVHRQDPRFEEVEDQRAREHLASQQRVRETIVRSGGTILPDRFSINVILAELSWDQVLEIEKLSEVQAIESGKTCTPPP